METQAISESVAEKILDRINAMAIDIAVIKSNYATKEDIARTHEAIARTHEAIAKMEAKLLKWFFGIGIGVASLGFAAVKFIH